MSAVARVVSSPAAADCRAGSPAAFWASAAYPPSLTMFSSSHAAGIAMASATVVASHNAILEMAAANRTPSNLLCDAPQVGGLPEVLSAVVDDAHQSRAGRHRRVPVGVHYAAQLVGRHAGD